MCVCWSDRTEQNLALPRQKTQPKFSQAIEFGVRDQVGFQYLSELRASAWVLHTSYKPVHSTFCAKTTISLFIHCLKKIYGKPNKLERA